MFATRLKELRDERGVSRGDISAATGVAQSSLGNYERGDRSPDATILIKLSKYFKVSTDYLLGISDNDTPPAGSAASLPEGLREDAGRTLDAMSRLLEYEKQADYSRNCFKHYAALLERLADLVVDADETFNELKQKYPGFTRADPFSSVGADAIDVVTAITSNDEAFHEFVQDFNNILARVSLDAEKMKIIAKQCVSGIFDELTGRKNGEKRTLAQIIAERPDLEKELTMEPSSYFANLKNKQKE